VAKAWSLSVFVKEFKTIFAPAPAMARAIPKPIPEVDPVITARFPERVI
jgi:hypothetical protein